MLATKAAVFHADGRNGTDSGERAYEMTRRGRVATTADGLSSLSFFISDTSTANVPISERQPSLPTYFSAF